MIGGGNAALRAAIEAAEAGARVLILEAAPKPCHGGNSRHIRNFRCLHGGPAQLARTAIRLAEDCLPWMEAHCVRFRPALSGTLSRAPTPASWAAARRS
ncbi:FAD-binding protein [Roseivivax sp. CAU 1761]